MDHPYLRSGCDIIVFGAIFGKVFAELVYKGLLQMTREISMHVTGV